ncbi:hypothetical protein BJ742DRAFT_798861 [Cladochytrium replicatum]|nr:hypothetical protein BJ742DRAFT_798861 [Cladochytrium replicatum]
MAAFQQSRRSAQPPPYIPEPAPPTITPTGAITVKDPWQIPGDELLSPLQRNTLRLTRFVFMPFLQGMFYGLGDSLGRYLLTRYMDGTHEQGLVALVGPAWAAKKAETLGSTNIFKASFEDSATYTTMISTSVKSDTTEVAVEDSAVDRAVSQKSRSTVNWHEMVRAAGVITLSTCFP